MLFYIKVLQPERKPRIRKSDSGLKEAQLLPENSQKIQTVNGKRDVRGEKGNKVYNL